MYVSTTSPEDLSTLQLDRTSFVKDQETEAPEMRAILAFPHRWFISTYGGCSCNLRHTANLDLADMFGPPEDWCPKDDDDVAETAKVYDHLRRLVEEGHEVDVVDLWTDTPLDDLITVPIRVSEISREAFRFAEGARFVLGH